MTKNKTMLAAIVVAALAALGFGYSKHSTSCPGKIVCPLTGDTVCVDDCPLRG